MINRDKSLVIFTHPRSGSTWFQFNLFQTNLSELFNFNLTIKTDENGTYIVDEPNTDSFVDRENIYKYFNNKFPISIKIHPKHLTKKVINFLENKEFQYILLERKNKFDVFWSFLIAETTKNWHYEYTNPTEIKVTKSTFDTVISSFKRFSIMKQFVTFKYNPVKIYYEDLPQVIIGQDWWKNENFYKIQNAKDSVSIINKNEIYGWLEDYENSRSCNS